MSIKDKIMLSYLAVALIIGFLGGFAFYHDIDRAETIAGEEAVHLARTFSLLVVDGRKHFTPPNFSPDRRELQAHVDQFRAIQKNSIAIIDRSRLIIASTAAAEAGAQFIRDPNDETGRTLQDGRIRFFTEKSRGSKFLVAPLDLTTGERVGAVVLEYTPLYNEIMNTSRAAAKKLLLLYVGGLLLALAVGYLISRHIARPLIAIKDAAHKVAQGDLDARVERSTGGELGQLAHSFNQMTESLRQSRDQLMQSHDRLEAESFMRKMSEKALLENRQKLWTMFEFATDALFILDLNGNFIDVNRTAYERLGYSKAEMLSMHISLLDPPEFAAKIPERFEQITSAGWAIFESAHLRKDGTVMPVEINSRTMDLNDKKVVFSMVRDITERKLAEDALKKTNARLQALIYAIPDMVFFKDAEGRHLTVNKAVEDLLGHSRDEIVGKTVYDLMPPGPAEACRISDDNAMRQSGPSLAEEQIPGTDGNMRFFEFVKAPIFDSENRCLGLVTIGRDITERKWVEAELAKHRDQLMLLVEERTRELTEANAMLRKEISERERMEEELIKVHKLESLGILAGGIAHDFNNMLTAILGNVSMAMLDLDQTHPSYRQLANAERASLRAQDLTQQLLTFSKGGAPVRKTTSIGDLIRESVTFALSGSRARCDISLAADLRLVDADEGQMSQVMHNLLINADQAMPAGGVIKVSAENRDLDAASAVMLAPGKYVKITIQDSGVGIPREHLSKIFDPFFTTKQKGSGLGLATTYSIIKKHDGGISVDSSPGAGTLVTILLPASGSSRTAGTAQSSALKSASGRILIMDDEESVRQTTGDALTRLGYSVDFAEDGAVAIDRYQEALHSGQPFDLVIMDLTIPGGMGGKEAIGKLLRINPKVKALVSSGYANDPVMAEFRISGFAGVVSKPFRLKELSDAVYRALTNNGADPGRSDMEARE